MRGQSQRTSRMARIQVRYRAAHGDPSIVKQIVWELYELNFRFEFRALDRLLRGDLTSVMRGVAEGGSSVRTKVQSCFPGAVGNPSEIGLSKANCGLAAASISHRARYFCRMCEVIKDWPGGSHGEMFLTGKVKFADYMDNDLEAMEKWATRFYYQAFYEKFGRPQLLPHRLNAS